MGPNLGGGWDTTDWGTLDYYRAGGIYGDSGDFLPLTFNPIPTGHGQNQPIYECHVTTAGRYRVIPKL